MLTCCLVCHNDVSWMGTFCVVTAILWPQHHATLQQVGRTVPNVAPRNVLAWRFESADIVRGAWDLCVAVSVSVRHLRATRALCRRVAACCCEEETHRKIMSTGHQRVQAMDALQRHEQACAACQYLIELVAQSGVQQSRCSVFAKACRPGLRGVAWRGGVVECGGESR